MTEKDCDNCAHVDNDSVSSPCTRCDALTLDCWTPRVDLRKELSTLRAERDAAVARAEKAEAELADLRRHHAGYDAPKPPCVTPFGIAGEREFDEGDIVWIIYPRIAVRCKVTRVDRSYRKRHPDGTLFYDVDEPIGHSITEGEMFVSREEAYEALQDLYGGTVATLLNKECGIADVLTHSAITAFDADLVSSRLTTLRFVRGSHHGHGVYGGEDIPLEAEAEAREMLAFYPPKEEGVDWFRLSRGDRQRIHEEVLADFAEEKEHG